VLVPTVIGHVGWNTTGIFCSGAKIRVRGGVSGHVEVDGYEATALLQVALSDLNSIWLEWRDVCPASNGRSDGVRRAHCQTIETLKMLPSENPSADLLFVEGDCRFVMDI
jgi:hypothetical protein